MHVNPAMSGGRLGKQIRRMIPLCTAFLVLFLLSSQANHFPKYQHTTGDVLKRMIAYQKTLRYKMETTKFPKKIWQTWKVDPLDFDERDSTRARTWTRMNPNYRYEVLTDGNDMDYVETHFGPDGENRHDIVETYRTLKATIIKADLLRYLVMYIEGGVYADIDVEALRPVDQWIPDPFRESNVGLVISVEIDEPSFANHTILGPKSRSFCQWTFMCKPRQPVMMRLIEHVLHWLNEVSQRQNRHLSEIELNFDEVITGTGPSAFTNAMLAEMSAQTHHRVHWDTFHALERPVLVGNILVMTVRAFAAGQGHSNAGTHESEEALIKHHYHASLWPSRHPRYSHPAYGMVEECNWAADCVSAWTENTAVFGNLPEDQKQKLIADHEEKIKQKFDDETAENEKNEREDRERKEDEIKSSCRSFLAVQTSTQTQTHTQTEEVRILPTKS